MLLPPDDTCDPCAAYFGRRRTVILPAIVVYAGRRGMHALDLLVQYAEAVHQRHLAGLSLATDGSA